MNFVWDYEPTTSADIVAALEESCRWKPRTIRTLLARLVKKGALRATTDGKRHLFSAVVSRQASVKSESRSFLQRVFGGETAPMLINLVKETELSKEEIKELRSILNQKEKS